MQDEPEDKGTLEALGRLAQHVELTAQHYISAGQQLAAAAEVIKQIKPAKLEGLLQISTDALRAGFEQIVSSGWTPDLSTFEKIGRTGGIALAMDITGKSKSTIYNLVSQGKIPVAKNGGRLQFSEEALRAYSFQPRYPIGTNVPYPGAGVALIEAYLKSKPDEANADQ